MEDPERQPDPSQRSARPRRNAPVLLLILGLVAIVALVLGSNSANTLKVDVSQANEFVMEGKVANITIYDGKRLVGEFRDSAEEAKEHKKFEVDYAGPAENSEYTPELLKSWRSKLGADGKVEQKETSGFVTALPQILLWVGILVLFWFLILRQMGRVGGQNVSQFGRSRARLATKERSNVTFDDVAGIEEAEEEVTEIVAFLKSPQKFKKIGARIPRGVMLVGPPGCGKTLLAKAIAGEAGVPFFSVSGSDFVEMFVGVGASRVRDLFKQARENSPCIIFLDEIDAVGRRRGTGLGGGHDEREQTLNQILVEMDGFDTDQGIILLAATNRPDVLDPALLRPGRFDRNLVINLPDIKGREQILRIHSRKVKMSPSADLSKVARATPGFSGADLEALVNEAALMAVTAGRDRVTFHDMEEARDKIRFGRSRKSMIMSDTERETTAYHEAGHTIVNVLEEKADPLHKVTIIPRGMALGVTMMLPAQDRHGMSRKELLARLRVAYGGRVAEDLIFDDITNGAQNDIEQATEMARLMVTKWGMSDLVGPISYAEGEEHMFLGREVARTVNHSEETAQLIDDEVKRLLVDAHKSARDTLESNLDALHAVAKALLKYETLDAEEVGAVMRGDSIDALRAARGDSAAAPPPMPEPSPEPSDGVPGDGRGNEGFAY
ncbi:MAG: ATP-dependent zinc metalloprotease FtsH [Planctomycetota bacterium]|nr:ATP-dependent zinc metalloprotease FtsH [Planctomycetota bacterium]